MSKAGAGGQTGTKRWCEWREMRKMGEGARSEARRAVSRSLPPRFELYGGLDPYSGRVRDTCPTHGRNALVKLRYVTSTHAPS